jgi:hypothetical protein
MRAGAAVAWRAALRVLEGVPSASPTPQVSTAALATRAAVFSAFTSHKRWVSSDDSAEAWDSIRSTFTSILADVDTATGIATLTINRPEALNALNSKVPIKRRRQSLSNRPLLIIVSLFFFDR